MDAAPGSKTLPGLEILEVTPGMLESLLPGATEESLTWQPAADRWSIRDILAHLAEVEVNVMRVRARRMAEEVTPALEFRDQEAAFASGRYAAQDPRLSLERFRRTREESLARRTRGSEG